MGAVRRWPAFVGVFAAAFDNFAMTPLVRAIATDMGVQLGEATAVATAYYLSYGLLQVPWGMASERVGRVAVFRAGLVLGVVGSVASAFAGSLDSLLLGRFLAGAGMAAVVPAVIAWIGDVLPEDQRQQAAVDVNMMYALGSATGVVGAGLVAESLGWAAGFAISGTLAVLALFASIPLFVPKPPATPGKVREALAVSHVRRLAVIGLIEGAVLFGLFAFLAPTLLSGGVSAKAAGALIGGYGVSVVFWSRVARRLSGKVNPVRSMTLGGALFVTSWAAVAIAPGPIGVVIASMAMGATIVFFHSQLQVWATQAAPHARGPAIAFFSGSLFVGASLGSRLARPLFDAGHVSALFGIGAVVALGVSIAAVIARKRSLA